MGHTLRRTHFSLRKIHRFYCLLSQYLPGNHTPKPLKSFRRHHEVAKLTVNRCHVAAWSSPRGHHARLASDFAFAEVVRIRASFEYTPGCKTRQNRSSTSLFRYSAKSTLAENVKLWGDFCALCQEFKQHVFAAEQGMIRCNHCGMLCLPGAFETPQWSVYDREHWRPSGRRERNGRRSHKAIHTF